jgi:hypothetical protein
VLQRTADDFFHDFACATVDFVHSTTSAQTVAAVPADGTPQDVASARDEAVRRMQPMIEAVWERAASNGEKQPRLVIRVDD